MFYLIGQVVALEPWLILRESLWSFITVWREWTSASLTLSSTFGLSLRAELKTRSNSSVMELSFPHLVRASNNCHLKNIFSLHGHAQNLVSKLVLYSRALWNLASLPLALSAAVSFNGLSAGTPCNQREAVKSGFWGFTLNFSKDAWNGIYL